MDPLLEKYHLPFSIGHHEVVSALKQYSKKQKPSVLPRASKALIKKIEKYKQDLIETGLPSFLEIATVNEYIQTGVFLKTDAKPLKKGTFIGIYTGDYELVFASETQENHYAYDVATEIKLKKHLLPLVRAMGKKLDIKESYSIQTNALHSGNFTRYINHSSIDTNIDAFTKVMPDGTVEVCLFTRKTIYPGEQLLSNYGGMYWAVLPIIPEPVFAKTYMLTKKNTVLKREKKDLSAPSSQHPLLKTLRNPLEMDTSDLPKSFKGYLSKKKIRCLSASIIEKIEAFEDEILERAIPMNLSLSEKKNGSYDLFVKEKKIKKGAFLGVLGGSWSLEDHLDHDKFDTGLKYNQKTLYLDIRNLGNFTRLIPYSKEGNLKISLYKKRGTLELFFVVTAAKDINKGQKLSLITFEKTTK